MAKPQQNTTKTTKVAKTGSVAPTKGTGKGASQEQAQASTQEQGQEEEGSSQGEPDQEDEGTPQAGQGYDSFGTAYNEIDAAQDGKDDPTPFDFFPSKGEGKDDGKADGKGRGEELDKTEPMPAAAAPATPSSPDDHDGYDDHDGSKGPTGPKGQGGHANPGRKATPQAHDHARPAKAPTKSVSGRKGGNSLDRLFVGQMLYRSVAGSMRAVGLEPLMPLLLVSGIALLGAGKLTAAVGKFAGKKVMEGMRPLMDRLKGGDANQRELHDHLEKLNSLDAKIGDFGQRWEPTIQRMTGKDVHMPMPDPYVPVTMTNWMEASHAKAEVKKDSNIDVKRHGRHLIVRESQLKELVSGLQDRGLEENICDSLGRRGQAFQFADEKTAEEFCDRVEKDTDCLAVNKGGSVFCVGTDDELAQASAINSEYGARSVDVGPIAPGDAKREAEERGGKGPGQDVPAKESKDRTDEPKGPEDKPVVGEDGLGPEGDASKTPELTEEQISDFRSMAEMGIIDKARLEEALAKGPDEVLEFVGNSRPGEPAKDTKSQEPKAQEPRAAEAPSEGKGRDIVAESQAAERREDIGNNQTTADYVQSRPNSNDSDRSTPWSDGEDAPGQGDKDGDGVMDSAEDIDGDGVPDHDEERDRAKPGRDDAADKAEPKPAAERSGGEPDLRPGKTRGANGEFSSPSLDVMAQVAQRDQESRSRGRDQRRERPRGPQEK